MIEVPAPRKIAIIGTREPDVNQSIVAKNLAFSLTYLKGFVVKTGAAVGIDFIAMKASLVSQLEVYLPWGKYNMGAIPYGTKRVVYNPMVHRAWTESVTKFHPNPKALTNGAVCLHARNYGIVENCELVIAFPNAVGGGGTAQGIRIAKHLGIPVIQGNKGSVNPPDFCISVLLALGLVKPEICVQATAVS